MSDDTWIGEVRALLERSKVTVLVAPADFDDVDNRFALELGLSILMNKPLVLAVRPDWPVPAKLLRAADRRVEIGPDVRANAEAIFNATQFTTGDVARLGDSDGLAVHDPEPYMLADEAATTIVEGMDPDGSNYQRLVMTEFVGRANGEIPAVVRVMTTRDGALTVGRMMVEAAESWPEDCDEPT